jgi:hypothetical protein
MCRRQGRLALFVSRLCLCHRLAAAVANPVWAVRLAAGHATSNRPFLQIRFVFPHQQVSPRTTTSPTAQPTPPAATSTSPPRPPTRPQSPTARAWAGTWCPGTGRTSSCRWAAAGWTGCEVNIESLGGSGCPPQPIPAAAGRGLLPRHCQPGQLPPGHGQVRHPLLLG